MYLKDKGFKRGTTDNNLYMKTDDNNFLIVLVYVDDIIFGCNKDSLVQWFASAMESEFEISMIGELLFFLGLQITHRHEGMFISQENYLREMMKIFQMEDSKPMGTPMVTGCKLRKDDDSPDVDQSSYRSMIGSML
jgi:uncharacterized membrane protein YciS (DUF1049 family)